MDPIIEFRDFSFKYRSQTQPTLSNINLKIYPGEKVMIAGPSGSGKSTLAHCINALIPCSFGGDVTGTLIVDGKNPSKEGVFGMSKKVGTVLQDTDGQFIGLTVAEDLAFALENDETPQGEIFDKVDRVAELVQMKKYLKHSPSALSGGQKQRVSLGGVLVDDVRILLFDEPLANLDPATGKRTIALIDDIMKQGDVTTLIIEHRLEDVLYKNVDRVIVVDNGQIIADMKPDELLCSDILVNQGIREPLYVSAIKHAGMTISPADKPSDIETMNIAPYAEGVTKWFRNTEISPKANNESNVLEITDLSFAYDKGINVLENISFSVKKGEMISIVGKNGAGKSTLSELICGFYKPLSGTIKLDGKDIAPLSVKERGERIGLVMQSPNQMISKPMIMDEVGLGLSVRGVPEDEIKSRVNETLKICGLYPFRNWPVNALSFGQKKRVSIASILVMKPEIMILDEPTAGQDYRHYTSFMNFLKKLNEETGITILMITHDMHLMLEYTDRAIVLSDGHLLTDDTPSKVLTNEEVADKAYLKKTSLYDLALKCGIEKEDATKFVDTFIAFERSRTADESSADKLHSEESNSVMGREAVNV